MSTFKDIRESLALLTMGQMKDSDIGLMVNKALREEVESWQWSSLFKTGVIWGLPDNVYGVVSLVNGQRRVLGTFTNFPTTFPDYIPPENWVLVAGSQYMPMEVERFVSPTELHLREPWGDVTQSNVAFNLRPQFYSVPGATKVTLARQILPILPISRAMLHLADPARLSGTSTPSTRHAEAGYDLQGNARIELWFRPGGLESFVIEYRERFKPLVSDNSWPQIPSAVVEQKAAMYCYASLYASSGDQAWRNLMQAAKAQYDEELSKAIRDDVDRQTNVSGSAVGVQFGYEIWAGMDPPNLGAGGMNP